MSRNMSTAYIGPGIISSLVTPLVSDIAYVITSIPQVATQYSFVLLAIDRVVGVAFPYRYRNKLL